MLITNKLVIKYSQLMGRKIYQSSLIRAHAKKKLNKHVSQYSREQFTDEQILIQARSFGTERCSVAAGFSDGVQSINFKLIDGINQARRQSQRAV